MPEAPASLAGTLGGVEKGMSPPEMSGRGMGQQEARLRRPSYLGGSIEAAPARVLCALAGASPGLPHMCRHKNIQETISKPPK